MNRAQQLQSLVEVYKYSDLKNRKITLDPEERDQAMKAGCTWNYTGEPTCAIWKARTKAGKIVYGSNTHRAMSVEDTLPKAIQKFPFIQSTA